MIRRLIPGLATLACLATAPVLAQERASVPTRAEHAAAGPRLQPQFGIYQPSLVQRPSAVAAASSSKTTITISTVALVAIVVVLLLLLL